MTFSTTQQRMALRDELIRAYNPLCQTPAGDAPGDLAFKLAELEKKHQEQMMQLLASANEAEAPAHRRRIGFVNDSA